MPRNSAPRARDAGSLAYPADPLAAIRELHALDAQPAATGPAAGESGHESVVGATAPPPAPATGSEDSSAVADATGSRVSSVTRTHRPRGREPRPQPDESDGPGHPLDQAVRELLARPYTADPKRGPFTVSTVKIPTEVWERLGWVAAVTGRPKQEILADALKDHFDRLLREA